MQPTNAPSHRHMIPPYLDPCVLTTALMGMVPAIIAAVAGQVSGPGQHDFMAALGAAPASALVLLYCQRKGRGLNETASAFLASGMCGMIVPGAALWNWAPAFAQQCTWHVWALLGALAGLSGWFVVLAAIVAFELRAPKLVNEQLDKHLPGTSPNKDDPDK